MATQTGFDPQPITLEGKLVRLEPLTFEHAAGLLAVGAEEAIWRFFSVAEPSSLAEATRWIEIRLADQAAGQRIPFAVICLGDGEFAGSTGYAAINRQHHRSEMASWAVLNYRSDGVKAEGKFRR